MPNPERAEESENLQCIGRSSLHKLGYLLLTNPFLAIFLLGQPTTNSPISSSIPFEPNHNGPSI
jgi:hypothetical protein